MKTLQSIFDYQIEELDGVNTIIDLNTVVFSATGTRAFVGQYGSMNCYEDEYDEYDYVYRITLDDLTEMIADLVDYAITWNGYEEFSDFIATNPSEADIKNMLDWFKFTEDQTYELAEKVMDLAQAQYEYNSQGGIR